MYKPSVGVKTNITIKEVEKSTQFLLENLKERYSLECLDGDGRITLKWISKEYDGGGGGLYCFGSAWEPVASFFEHGNEP
jgi:hypothetical protein